MKKYDYYRPSSASLGRKRKPRRKVTFSFLKPVIILGVLALLFMAGYVAFSKAYLAFSSSGISSWRPKTVAVSGVDGIFNKEITELAQNTLNKPFSVKDSVSLRQAVMTRYPMLRKVSVKRGLMSGKLKISAERRTPVAKFVLPDQSVQFIDSDSTVYVDPNPNALQTIPFVELEGKIPEKLSGEFVDLVKSTLALDKNLNFAFLRFNLTDNTVKMYMPDGCIIDFGKARNLKQKAVRAAQIIAFSRDRLPHPQQIDFEFFDSGKVFSRQIAN